MSYPPIYSRSESSPWLELSGFLFQVLLLIEKPNHAHKVTDRHSELQYCRGFISYHGQPEPASSISPPFLPPLEITHRCTVWNGHWLDLVRLQSSHQLLLCSLKSKWKVITDGHEDAPVGWQQRAMRCQRLLHRGSTMPQHFMLTLMMSNYGHEAPSLLPTGDRTHGFFKSKISTAGPAKLCVWIIWTQWLG